MSSKFIEKYYREFFDVLLTFAKKRIKDKDRAYDLVQDTYLEACRKPDEFMSSANPEGWLMNTLKFMILREYKLSKYMTRFFVSFEAESSTLDDIQNRLSMEEYFKSQSEIESRLSRSEFKNRLSENDWHLLYKIYYENKKIVEVAQELTIPYETCKKRVQSARRRLQKELEKNL